MASPADAARVEDLTRQIAQHAQSKQLDSALELYANILSEGLRPTGYTYSALINAHVVSGDVEGGMRLLGEMGTAGFKPNVIVLTTLLKGHCAAGDLDAARELLESMARRSPPVRPDARTLNTFMRGCVRVGDLDAASWAFGRLDTAWKLAPSEPATVAHGRLLSQGLRLGELRAASEAYGERCKGGGAAHRPTRTANGCLFWERGRCDRGLNCNFYHDPAFAQHDAHVTEAAQRDAAAELAVHKAHAAALLGRRAACRHALRSLRANLAASGDAASSYGEENQMAGFRRDELGRDADRVEGFLNSALARGAPAPHLGSYYARTLIFSSRLAGTDTALQRPSAAAVGGVLLSALKRTLGLERAAAAGLADLARVERLLGRLVSKRGRLVWGRLFRDARGAAAAPPALGVKRPRAAAKPGAKGARLPVKLEIASGTGDWVVAQAQADAGRANWAAVELRHDRVYSLFSRMVLGAVPNLCAIGGDAGLVVREHIRPRSVAHAFINFPEPPSGKMGYADASNALHLLTPQFFRELQRTLQPGGRLTIFSDNGRYSRTLAASIGALRAAGAPRSAPPLLTSVTLPDGAPWSEEIEGVRLYHGTPGEESGHLRSEQSYFDRFWEYRQDTERFFMLLERPL